MKPRGATLQKTVVLVNQNINKNPTSTITLAKEHMMFQTDYLDTVRLVQGGRGGGGRCQNINTALTFPNFLQRSKIFICSITISGGHDRLALWFLRCAIEMY